MESYTDKLSTTRRVEALGDAVFAIAMTILILGFAVPVPHAVNNGQALNDYLLKLVPRIENYIAAFLVLGYLWIGHHNQFRFIKRTSIILLWINILFFCVISIVPFTCNLSGTFPRHVGASVIFTTNLLLGWIILLIHWLYATSHPELMEEKMDSLIAKGGSYRVAIIVFIFVMAVFAALLKFRYALYIYIALPFVLPWLGRTVIFKKFLKDEMTGKDEAPAEPDEQNVKEPPDPRE